MSKAILRLYVKNLLFVITLCEFMLKFTNVRF